MSETFERFNRTTGQYEIVGINGVISTSGAPVRDPFAEGAASNDPGLTRGRNSLSAFWDRLTNFDITSAEENPAVAAQETVEAIFDPVRWITGAAGIALILGGIFVSARS